MARYLAIDWDVDRLRVVEADAKGGQVTLRQVFSWPESIRPNVAQAEEAGRRLAARLAEAGLRPAPVLLVVGRDYLIAREVQYPTVPTAEEPAVVGFQAVKELSFPGDDAVLDYLPLSTPSETGGRRALAFVLHRDMLATFQQCCQIAGLKLEAVTARAAGLWRNWQTTAGEVPATEAHAVLSVTSTGGELCVGRGQEILFTRTLPAPPAAEASDALRAAMPEVRRSLAAYATQWPEYPVQGVHAASIVDASVRDVLSVRLRLPVTVFDPLAGMALATMPQEERGAFGGILGVLQSQADKAGLPLNFLKPRKVEPPPKKTKYYVYAAAALVALIAPLGLGYWWKVSERDELIRELTQEKATLQKNINAFGDMEKRLEAIQAWSNSEIVQLDELYDLFALFPDHPGVRIDKVAWASTPPAVASTATPAGRAAAVARVTTPAPKPVEKPIGKLVIEASGNAEALAKLKEALENERHWKLQNWDKDVPAPGQVRATFGVYRRLPGEYRHVLRPTTNVNSEGPSESRRRGPEGRFGAGGRP